MAEPQPPTTQFVAVIKLKATPANREEWDRILVQMKEFIKTFPGKIVLAEPIIYQEILSQI